MNKHYRNVLYGFTILAFFIILAAFHQISPNLKVEIAFATVLFTIILFVSGIIIEYLAVLIFFTIMTIFKIAPQSIIFSGFSSEGFWLIFSGVAIGASIKQSGLSVRISALLMQFCKGSYTQIITGMVAFGVMMAFIMPSAMGRVMLMIPVLLEFADRSGFTENSKGRMGIILAGVFSTYITGFTILPSNLPNIILMGSMGTLYHSVPVYSKYLLLHFPVLGLLKLLILIVVINKLFREERSGEPILNQEKTSSKITNKEKRLIYYLAALLLIWMTDFIHHISPAWSALAIAILCLLPIIGLLNHHTFMKQYNFAPLLYVAGIISLSAVVNYTGLGNILAHKMLSITPFIAGDQARNFTVLTAISTTMGIITTLPGVPAIMTPLAKEIASSSHLSLSAVLMTQVLGFSTFIFPYQAPPILVAARLGNIKLKKVAQLCLIMTLLTIVFLFPLDFLWWKLVGWL